jgi:hypothetical protein
MEHVSVANLFDIAHHKNIGHNYYLHLLDVRIHVPSMIVFETEVST